MEKKFFLITIFIFINGCSQYPSVTDNEQKAIYDITQRYGGKCEITNKSDSQITLRISDCEYINSNDKKYSIISASNIALLLFRHTIKQENYDSVIVQTKFNDNVIYEYTHSKDDLLELENLMPFFERTTHKIQNQSYDLIFDEDFDSHLISSIGMNKLNEFVNHMHLQDSLYGNAQHITFHGFRTIKLNKRATIHIIGFIKRDSKEEFPFSICIDRVTKKIFYVANEIEITPSSVNKD